MYIDGKVVLNISIGVVLAMLVLWIMWLAGNAYFQFQQDHVILQRLITILNQHQSQHIPAPMSPPALSSAPEVPETSETPSAPLAKKK